MNGFCWKSFKTGLCDECLAYQPLKKIDVLHSHNDDDETGEIIEVEGDFEHGFKEKAQ